MHTYLHICSCIHILIHIHKDDDRTVVRSGVKVVTEKSALRFHERVTEQVNDTVVYTYIYLYMFILI
jgi:hypothetical protein